MVFGLRVLAVLLDLGVCFGLTPVVFGGIGWLVDRNETLGFVLVPAAFALFLVWPVLYFGLFDGLLGRTPGKWLVGLRVVDALGEKPSVLRALGRAALKVLAIGTAIGAVFCLVQVLLRGVTWYDWLCGTHVEHRPRVGLTATQKHFRRVYGDGRRGR